MLEISGSENTTTLREATEKDLHLTAYDHTKLSAINTCPVFGILRYGMHRRMPGAGRAMALEAGSVMHECFAFIRLVSLVEQYNGRPEFQDRLWQHHGTRLFGQERFRQIHGAIKDASDITELAKVGSVSVLDTSEFFDDPRDKRRTLSNLEEAIYAYINRWRWDHPVWIRNADDPTSDVGIEIPFDLVVEIRGKHNLVFRFTGRIDGIHYDSSNTLTCHDNKTASRLNDAWSMSFALNHQITGYCIASTVFTKQPINKAEILGLAIPLPKTYDYGGYIREVVSRQSHHYKRWIDWLIYTINLAQEYENNPYDAPRFTHSCSRYYRPCTFVPFCDTDDEEQRIMVSEMETDIWSPLNKPILDSVGDE